MPVVRPLQCIVFGGGPPCPKKKGGGGEAKSAKSNHNVRMMLNKDQQTIVANWTTRNVAQDFKKQCLRNPILLTVSGDREKAAIWRLDECDVGGQTILLQAILARMSYGDVLEWVRQGVFKEYKNLNHNRGLQGGKRGVHFVGKGSGCSRPVHCPHRRSRMRIVDKSRSHCVVNSACFIIKHYRLF